MSTTPGCPPELPSELKELIPEAHVLKKTTRTVKALDHTLRQKILQMIHHHGRITVKELYQKLRMEQSNVSQHLAWMRQARLVVSQREGRYIFYSVNYPQILRIEQLCRQLMEGSSAKTMLRSTSPQSGSKER